VCGSTAQKFSALVVTLRTCYGAL